MTDHAPDQSTPASGERRPVAMTPYAIGVALFAAFVVGGIIAKAVPLWLVVVLGLVVGVGVFALVDRYPRLSRR
jgi:UDP-N-acetylmuramyl pentapeptide phosphotransferase/UDP-N-acetylglucosamine-1-phosphate transferase